MNDPRIFAVGDVHGCYEKLAVLLDRLPVDPERDFLIFLGDYINRGPNSRESIDLLLKIRDSVKNTVFLLGNHEHSLLEYSRTCELDHLWSLRPMGVESTLESYGENQVRSLCDLSFLPNEHRDFLEHLVPYFRLGDYLFTHAGIIPGLEPKDCPLDRLLMVRESFLEYQGPLDAVVVFGHTPFEMPYVTPYKIGIDTGAVYGNVLTAVELPRLHFYHA